jgi:hypothetical protein
MGICSLWSFFRYSFWLQIYKNQAFSILGFNSLSKGIISHLAAKRRESDGRNVGLFILEQLTQFLAVALTS